MPHHQDRQPPRVCSRVVRIAGGFVPEGARSEWLAHWYSELRNWWVLYDRGEVALGPLEFCSAALRSALTLRSDTLRLTRTLRSPGFVIATAASSLLLVAILSGGFPVTWSVIHETLWGVTKRRYFHENRIVVYLIPITLAITSAAVLIRIGPLPLRAHGWKYWLYFLSKTTLILLLVPLLWIEGGSALRAHIPHVGFRLFGAGLGLTLVFIAFFAYALRWSFVDQRQRCPVCLRRLTLPVTLGSWASVFDPATTELICEDGHGSLAVTETLTGSSDHWTNLDASWRGL